MLLRATHQQHVVLVGDSVTRYLYLHLAYSLVYLRPPDFEFNRIEWKDGEKRAWDRFLEVTNAILSNHNEQSTEFCDCERGLAVENRFLRTAHGTHLSFFSWSPELTGRWRPGPHEQWPHHPGSNVSSVWSYSDCTGFLRDVVMKLRPRPSWVVMNRGLWGSLSWPDFTALLGEGQRLQQCTGVRFVWRTTTTTWGRWSPVGTLYPSGEECARRSLRERRMATDFGWGTIDFQVMTANLSRAATHDGVHFKEAVNVCFNRALAAELLGPRAARPLSGGGIGAYRGAGGAGGKHIKQNHKGKRPKAKG